VFLEQIPDAEEHVARDVPNPRLGAIDPDPQVEFDAIVAEFLDPADRGWFGQYTWRDGRGLDREPLRTSQIAIERHPKPYMNPANARDAMDGRGTLTITLDCARQMPSIRGHGGSPGPFVTLQLHDSVELQKRGDVRQPFLTHLGEAIFRLRT